MKNTQAFRNVASQVIATAVNNLVGFSHGSLTGFTVILLAELSQENSEIDITKDELSWFGSYVFMSPVGALLFGLLSHSIGSRMILLITSIIYIISCIIFYFATNSTMILVAQALVGLMILATMTCSINYIAEISQPHLRSSLITSRSMFTSFGSLFIMLMSQFFKWKIIAIIILTFSAMGLLGTLFVPDSPYWLARKGRFDEAEVALAWLRGWTTLDNVRSEFLSLKEANRDRSIKREDITSQKRSIRVLMKPYMEKSLWIPMCIVFYILIMYKLIGSESIGTYNVVIFRMNETPFDIYIAGTIYDGVRIVGGTICMFSVNALGKRKLFCISLVGAGSAYLVIAIVVHLIKLEIGNSSEYIFWIPPVMLIFASFILSMGIDKVSYMLSSELLPNRFRDIGMAIGGFVSAFLLAILRKSFLYMVDAMTIQGVFLFFGINCIIALITFYFIVPETEGKTLIEIENHMADKRSPTIKIEEL